MELVQVQRLTDQQLGESLKRLVKKERELTFRVLLHLVELDRRKVYVEWGYNSLYDYCIRAIGYSGPAAQRRIKAARALQRFPEIGPRIRDGVLSLSTLGMVADLLEKDFLDELLDKVCGKRREEVQRVVARYRPVPAAELVEMITPVVIQKPKAPPAFDFDGTLEERIRAELEFLESSNEQQEEDELVESQVQEQGPEEHFKITFTVSKEFKEKLDRARELSGRSSDDRSLENVLGKALDTYIERHCPKKRLERRLARETKRVEKKVVEAARLIDSMTELPESSPVRRSRYIPRALRDQVLARDNYRCSYVSPEGIPCECQWDLEIDHIVPFARGGETKLSNLRTVCYAHNLLFAYEAYGEEFMDQKINESRENSSKNVSTSARQLEECCNSEQSPAHLRV